MRSILAAVICATVPFAAHAQSYEAINRLNVIPLGGSSFEVIEARGEGPSGIWCAAASYAQDRVGLTNSTRIYIKTPRGPSISGAGRIGVVFTTDPSDLPSPPQKSYSISVDQQSIGLTIGHSSQYCKDYIIELNDL